MSKPTTTRKTSSRAKVSLEEANSTFETLVANFAAACRSHGHCDAVIIAHVHNSTHSKCAMQVHTIGVSHDSIEDYLEAASEISAEPEQFRDGTSVQ